MKMLILSWYFPPANDVAALRVGKFAEYLHNSGDDVWVITGERKHPDNSLSTSFPSDRVIRTPWYDVNRLGLVAPRHSDPGSSALHGLAPGEPAPLAPKRRTVVETLATTSMHMIQIPDRHVGWLPNLLRAGRALLRKQKVDLIYASGPPFTTFLAARRLGKRFGIPWIAEYRDGWSRYVYAPKPSWRQAVDSYMENRTTPSAAGIVTVSNPWAEHYRERFKRPTISISNGYDPENLPADFADTASPGPLTIVHMGALYSGLRDPSVLYEAVKRSGLSPQDVRICFYGVTDEQVHPLAARYGVSPFVAVSNRVPYAESLCIQRKSDVLLLLQSSLDPKNVPAKLFEYLAARRPILGIGMDDGIPARLIKERNAGFYLTEPDAIAAQLTRWMKQKRENGCIPHLPATVLDGLAREKPFRQLREFLETVRRADPKTANDAPVIVDRVRYETFRQAARAKRLDPDDIWVGGYVDVVWSGSRHLIHGYIPELKGASILEFGCNVGATAIVLARLGASVDALDVDAQMVELAKLNACSYGIDTIRFHAAEPGAPLPFAPGTFDAVSCTSVLEYVDPDLLPSVLAELDRVLKPGGVIIVCGTSNRLWPREVHSRAWFSNYVPSRLDPVFGRRQRGIFPWQVRMRGYRDLLIEDGAQAYFKARSATNSEMKVRLARVGMALVKPFGWSIGLFTPSICTLLRKPE